MDQRLARKKWTEGGWVGLHVFLASNYPKALTWRPENSGSFFQLCSLKDSIWGTRWKQQTERRGSWWLVRGFFTSHPPPQLISRVCHSKTKSKLQNTIPPQPFPCLELKIIYWTLSHFKTRSGAFYYQGRCPKNKLLLSERKHFSSATSGEICVYKSLQRQLHFCCSPLIFFWCIKPVDWSTVIACGTGAGWL